MFINLMNFLFNLTSRTLLGTQFYLANLNWQNQDIFLVIFFGLMYI